MKLAVLLVAQQCYDFLNMGLSGICRLDSEPPDYRALGDGLFREDV